MAEPPAKKAKLVESSYYRIIRGVKYDRKLLESIEKYAADGQVSFAEAKRLWQEAQDGNRVTDIEKETLMYGMKTSKFTDKAREYLEGQLSIVTDGPCGTGLSQSYLAKLTATMPRVDRPPDIPEGKILFESIAAFREQYKDDEVVLRSLRNKIKKCENCGKPCAFTLACCNACGKSLEETPLSFTDNIFMCFVYGVAKGNFPFKISIRYQDNDYLCFDDPLSMSTCHLNCIPTSVHIPDVRYLFLDPEKGLRVLQGLYDQCAKAALEQFWGNPAYRRTILGETKTPSKEDLRQYVFIGCNYPPSIYQLHLQFIHAPLLPFHYNQACNDNHFHDRRFFPLEWISKALEHGDEARMDIKEDTPIDDVIRHMDGIGVSYDACRAKLLRRVKDLQENFGTWKDSDFGCVVIDGKPLKQSTREAVPEDAAAIQKADTKALQNYGRPYGEDGNPSGVYYNFAKKPQDVKRWP